MDNSFKDHKDKYPLVALIMGSQSDWPTLKAAEAPLKQLNIPYVAKIVSAHRTPHRMVSFAEKCEKEGIKVIIAAAGGAAHLPGMCASITSLPVLGVPMPSKHLNGQDSLLSIVQMPAGVPVGTLAIGTAGAVNAALLAASILALADTKIANNLKSYRQNQTDLVPLTPKEE